MARSTGVMPETEWEREREREKRERRERKREKKKRSLMIKLSPDLVFDRGRSRIAMTRQSLSLTHTWAPHTDQVCASSVRRVKKPTTAECVIGLSQAISSGPLLQVRLYMRLHLLKKKKTRATQSTGATDTEHVPVAMSGLL